MVREVAGQAMQDLQNAEIALRDHVLSPSSASLAAYRDGWRPVFDRLAEEAPPRERQSRAGRSDRRDRSSGRGLSGPFRSRRDDVGPEPATAVASLSRGEGKALHGRIRELFADFDAEEATLLRARQSRAEQLQALLLGLTLMSLVLAMIASTAVVSTSWSYIRQLRAQSDALKAEATSRREVEMEAVSDAKARAHRSAYRRRRARFQRPAHRS